MDRTDVAIVGAGAAGLTAARELHRKGYRIVIFEARDRLGGRIFTHTDPRVPLPIELGAEFIHGEAVETRRILQTAGFLDYDIAGDHWRANSGRIRRAEFRKPIDRVLGRIDVSERDQSFSDFLARRPGGRRLAPDRVAAAEFVESFYAADLDQISVHSIASQEAPSASAMQIARIIKGYDRIPQWLEHDLRANVRLRTAVVQVSWDRGKVELVCRSASGKSSRMQARVAIVTVPLGVLQTLPGEPGGILLRPDPPRIRRALNQLAMGSVTRLSVWLRDFPWKDVRGLPGGMTFDRLSFLQTDGGPFNVWWTAYPVRWPLIVAWSGGPKAAALERLKSQEIASLAFEGLAHALGTTTRHITSRVQKVWTHNWDRDPFARGAYSYVRVGGSSAARTLSGPVEDTLFFAGEATHTQGQSGTVEAAIASGWRAARQVDSALQRH